MAKAGAGGSAKGGGGGGGGTGHSGAGGLGKLKRKPVQVRAGSGVGADPASEGQSPQAHAAGGNGSLCKVPAAGPEPSSISNFKEACEYLFARTDLERLKPNSTTRDLYRLDRMHELAKRLGDPQNALRMVHIAGTKGKGSTCEMVATCLEACGYTVGCYTSPHILDVRERMRINRSLVSENAFVELTKRVAAVAQEMEAEHGPATFFELTTAMALLYFAEEAVDAAVIEVGLGGLLDCTNIITPEVAAVTMIGFDHMEILGKTLEEIAAQKAGIYKPGVPALTFEQDKKVLEVLRSKANAVGAPFSVVGQDIDFTARTEFVSGVGPLVRASLVTERNNYDHVTVPLKGEHQANNCGLALAILDKLSERGFNCPADLVSKGLDQTRLPGRFELVTRSPRVLADVAHNPESMQALMRTMSAHLPYDSLVVVFGCAADKDIPGMLKQLAAAADKVIFTKASGNARATSPSELARKYHEVSGGKMFQVARDLGDAMELGLRAVGRDDVLCVTGSFYIVGEAKKWLAAKLAAKKK